jgi:hypothetical protein
VRSRQFGLGFVAAALGLAIVMLAREQEYSIYVRICGIGFNLDAIAVIIVASAFALYAVELLDLNVYHKMLRGAVIFGEDFEEKYMKQIFSLNKGMTQAVSHYSRHQDANVTVVDGQYTYIGQDRKDAYKKIRTFYRLSIGVLAVTACAVFLVTADFGHPHSKPNMSTSKADMTR